MHQQNITSILYLYGKETYYIRNQLNMEIDNLCAAVQASLHDLSSKKKDHSHVKAFQDDITAWLNKDKNGYKWETEKKHSGRSEKDSVDIFGHAPKQPNWIIEIDATRSDQVAKKFLSRLVIWGLEGPIHYVAILYPDTQDGKNECEKFLRYGYETIKKINKDSRITGIFVNPRDNTVEVLDFKEQLHFLVNGIESISMADSAAEAIRQYLSEHSISYAELKKIFGKYVENKVISKSKSIGIQTNDDVTVYSYTQFRGFGICSYWDEFVDICGEKKLDVKRLRKYYVGAGGGKSNYVWRNEA